MARQPALFIELDDCEEDDHESAEDRARRLGRLRQMTYRRRHQFMAPMSESFTSTGRGC